MIVDDEAEIKPANLSHEAANAQAAAVGKMLNHGFLRIYDGKQPASANDSITDQQMLAELRFSKVAFTKPGGGVMISRRMTQKHCCRRGVSTWFRTLMRDGKTVVYDGSAGRNDCDLNMDDPLLRPDAKLKVEIVYAVTE